MAANTPTTTAALTTLHNVSTNLLTGNVSSNESMAANTSTTTVALTTLINISTNISTNLSNGNISSNERMTANTSTTTADLTTLINISTNIFTNLSTGNISGNETMEEEYEGQSLPIMIIMYFLCCVGLVANAMSIIATVNIPHKQTNHSKLIISLGVSDTLVIVGVLYHYAVYYVDSDCTSVIGKLIINIAILATLTNLLAMAFDHYFAITKPFKYQPFMTKQRGNCLVIMIWIFCVLSGLLDIFIGMMLDVALNDDFCWKIMQDGFDPEICIISFALIVFCIIVLVYTKIYCLVKRVRHRARLLHQEDEMHSHKAIVTTLLVIGTFALCYLPMIVFQITTYIKMKTDPEFFEKIENLKVFMIVHKVLFIFTMSNSIVDPIIYAVRLSVVQKGYKHIVYRLFPSRRYSINEEEFRHLQVGARIQRRSTDSTLMNEINTFTDQDTFTSRNSESEHYPMIKSLNFSMTGPSGDDKTLITKKNTDQNLNHFLELKSGHIAGVIYDEKNKMEDSFKAEKDV